MAEIVDLTAFRLALAYRPERFRDRIAAASTDAELDEIAAELHWPPVGLSEEDVASIDVCLVHRRRALRTLVGRSLATFRPDDEPTPGGWAA